ncbi:4'-phosphopantetheinyl transferase NpgA [Aspergillus sclerotioniger CBS 115572]|uniref:holo-[acyl-carrier-protein] synthase n=1 Tax=Aspergillus sclerotioniger CBS 115572 TaxID=1450535 RepID=A0A317X9L3_9EURO|nr:4'-phosphopantetheinyl transferase NpgA [Aspergillus sclerotioniger CBS 115572]PWY93260.1 4'-phosphopantetheinyl transferase NpgA [Aspergillus sclerotioniger CBS 115572]
MASTPDNKPPVLVRWYIDTRPLTAHITTLPLLSTLQPTEQEAIQKFYHLKDKHMSLASNLLKYLFIHRTCRIPWNQITISRTPAPHKRPCFIPSPTLSTLSTPIPTIDFNVSHQNSLVALAGTTYSHPNIAQVGIDITCVNERHGKRGPEPRTRSSFLEYATIFTEVFSARELSLIKSLTHPSGKYSLTSPEGIEYSYRVFFTYWALKEAYIKMTGEALLAPWLRELEFTNVIAPDAGEAYQYVKTSLYGKEVRDVRLEVMAFEEDFLIATAARGGEIGSRSGAWEGLVSIDIEKDVRPCAMVECQCLV